MDTNQPTCLEDLKPAPYNPRRITTAAKEGLGASVKRFGDIAGLVWNAASGHLVSGHQRLEALKALGAVFVPGNGANGNESPHLELPDGRCFTIRVVDWDEATERAANVTANNPHIGGEFDEGLGDILDGLADFEGFDDLAFPGLLEDCGVFDVDGIDAPDLPSGGKGEFQQITFTLHDAQAEDVKAALKTAISQGGAVSPDITFSAHRPNDKALLQSFEKLPGFQLRYVYFLDPTACGRLTVPILPFSEIQKRGAGMYLGKPTERAGSIDADAPGHQPGEGGSTPTSALQGAGAV